MKTQELSNHIIGNWKTLDPSQPTLKLERVDNQDLRKKILSFSYIVCEKMGFGRGTRQYMKKNGKGNKQFTLDQHVKDRVNAIH